MLNKILININNRINPYINNMVKGRMKLITINDMVDIIRENLTSITSIGFDAVIGIPRSGILPASIISLFTGKPLINIDDLRINDVYVSGVKKYGIKKILLVDDSVSSGITFNDYKSRVKSFGYDVITLSVFVHKSGFKGVDKYLKIIDDNILYEWSFLKSLRYYKIGFDLDGVLCDDTDIIGEKDIDNYKDKIISAKPFLVPQYRIDYIITNRLERFRNITVNWLRKYGVSYRKLFMWDTTWNSRKGRYGDNKINVIKNIKIGLFIESNKDQAYKINYLTGCPVLCISNMRLYD